MKILQLLSSPFFGGPERQTLRASVAMQKLGHEISFVVMPFGNRADRKIPMISAARAKGFEAVPLVNWCRYDVLSGVLALRKHLNRLRPDVITSHGYKPNILASFLRDMPTLAFLRSWTSQDWRVRIYESMDRMLLTKHPAVGVVSNRLKEWAMKCHVPERKIFFIPNSIEVQTLPPALDRAKLACELGISTNEPVIGVVGRLTADKGHRVLLAAVAALGAAGMHPHLVVVGDGTERESLGRQARELGIGDRVHFVGFREDAPRWIGAFECLALPSLVEGMPNVVLEAMAYRIPVVATDVGAVPEMIGADQCVPPRDPVALAGAIQRTLSDRVEAPRRAEERFRLLEERHTVERQTKAWLQALEYATRSVNQRSTVIRQ